MNFEKIRSIFKNENVSKIINVSLIILIAASGYFLYLNFKKPPTKVTTNVPITSESITKKLMVVDVSGSVNKPGVYELETDSRIVDAITIAGGFTSNADQKYIDKNN